MYQTFQFLHSYWAYLVLLIIILATINALKGFFTKSEFKSQDFRISLFALIATHIQIILGILVYIYSPFAMGAIKEQGMSAVMKDSMMRLFSIEHPLIMLIAVVLITIGYSKHKKKEDSNSRFKTLAIFYTIALVLVLSRIPWTNWFN